MVLDQKLTPSTHVEKRQVNTVRRIAAIILLQPMLNENYGKVKAAAFHWTSKPGVPR